MSRPAAPDLHGRADVEALGRAVRARRRQLGLTQREASDLAGVSPRFLHALEHGKPTVQLTHVLAVLEVLGLSLALRPGRGRIETDEANGPDAVGEVDAR